MSASAAHAAPAASPADADDGVWPHDAVEVGRVIGAWGVKGWLRIDAFAADPQALFSSRRWYVRPPEGPAAPRAGARWPTLLKVAQAREHGDGIVAQVHGVDARDAAEALRGARLFVPRGSFPTAGADEFYWVDLIGLDVVNREGVALGRVVGLLDTGPHSVLRVAAAAADAEERLIPFVAAYVDEVRLAERLIRVDWGLDF